MRVDCKPSNRWSFQLDNLFWELISKPSHGSGEDQLFVYSGLGKLEVWRGEGGLYTALIPTLAASRPQLIILIECNIVLCLLKSVLSRHATRPQCTRLPASHTKTTAVVRIMSYSWFPYPSARWEIVVPASRQPFIHLTFPPLHP